jgi:thiamine biosynthesis lipoprotein
MIAHVLTLTLALGADAPAHQVPENEVKMVKSNVVKRTKELMHTKVTVAIAGSEPTEERNAAIEAVFDIFEHIERVMNEWKKGSPLDRINEAAGREAVNAPQDLCEVINVALDGAKRTNGLFDPTWASLNGLWKFDTETGEPPPADALQAACKLVGYKKVEVKPLPKPTAEAACSVKLKDKGMRLGLGGLVKGWGVDQATKELRKRGYKDFFVQAGGDLFVSGKNGDDLWKVGIRDPRGPAEKSFARTELSNASFSTSGDYEHFFIKDGVRYHHIIDLRTCMPATASVSSTVLAKTATDAEFLTKSTFILGGEKGLELAEKFGAQAVLVDSHGKVHVSKSLQGKIEIWPPSGFGADAGVK